MCWPRNAAEGVPPDDRMSGGGIRQWAKRRRKENVDEGGGIRRVMGWRRKAVTNYCRLRGGKGIGRWWNEKIGRVEDAECLRCGEEEETSEHIVFQCGNIRRVEDERGKREWAIKEGMRWDSCIVLYCICSPY